MSNLGKLAKLQTFILVSLIKSFGGENQFSVLSLEYSFKQNSQTVVI